MIREITLRGIELRMKSEHGIYKYDTTALMDFNFIHFILNTAKVPLTFWFKEDKDGKFTAINGDKELNTFCYYMRPDGDYTKLAHSQQNKLEDVLFQINIITHDTSGGILEFLMKYLKEQS